MSPRTFWTAVGLALAATFVIHAMPRVRYRYLSCCAAWLLCAAFIWEKAHELGLLAVPALAVVALTAMKLVQADHEPRS